VTPAPVVHQHVVYNHVVNHIGINVPDLDAAVAWYAAVLGFQVIRPAADVVAGQGGAGKRFKQLNGPRFAKARVAYLTAGNGVGIEMFEFVEPRTGRFADDWEFWRPGIWHLCVTTPDVATLAAEIAAKGGRHRTEVIESPPGSGLSLTFCQDPWGNPIELMNASFDWTAEAS